MSRVYPLESGTAVVLATADETGGAYSIVEFTARPGHSRHPHIHRQMEEAFLMLDGEGTFLIGEEERTARPGDYLLVARSVVHNVFNRTDEQARWLEIYSPPGFEAYLGELAEAAAAHNGVIPLDVRASIMARHDIEGV